VFAERLAACDDKRRPSIAWTKPEVKRQSSGPGLIQQYGDIGTLTVDGWAVSYIWYSDEGPGRAAAAAPSSLLLVVPNVTAHPCNGQCTNCIAVAL